MVSHAVAVQRGEHEALIAAQHAPAEMNAPEAQLFACLQALAIYAEGIGFNALASMQVTLPALPVDRQAQQQCLSVLHDSGHIAANREFTHFILTPNGRLTLDLAKAPERNKARLTVLANQLQATR